MQMKKTSRMISLLLALTMLFLMAACGSTAASAPASEAAPPASEGSAAAEAPAAPEAPETAEAASSDAAEAAPSEADEAPLEKVDYTLPLFEEPYEVSIFWTQQGGGPGMDLILKQDNIFWQRTQENLNVKIDWTEPNASVSSEQYMLMVASGDMTDLVWHKDIIMGANTVYTSGYDAAIEDDVYLALNDYIPEYAPNYWYYLNTMDMLDAVTTTDGNLYAVHMIYDEPSGIAEGLFILTDLFEQTGLEMPETTGQWLDMFAALKDLGSPEPAACASTGSINGGTFASAFGTSLNAVYLVDGTTNEVFFDLASDYYREYLEYFKVLFDNGYINSDFISVDAMDNSPTFNGQRGSFCLNWAAATSMTSNFGITGTPCPIPYVDGTVSGQRRLIDYSLSCTNVSSTREMAITTACKEPEKALRFLDWFYSDEGIQVGNYGWVENESYIVLEDGSRQMTPLMLERDEKNNSYNTIYIIDDGPLFFLKERDWDIRPEKDVYANRLWNELDTSKGEVYNPGTISLTSEESTEIAQILSDISTYCETQMMAWMTGQDELTDESWNAYVSKLEEMGLGTMDEVYQAAYARSPLKIA